MLILWDARLLLWNGLLVTLALSVVGLLTSVLASCVFAGFTLAPFWPLRWIGKALTELFRDLPLISNFMFLFYGGPLIGLSLPAFWSAAISLTIWGGANGAEIIRGGFLSVHKSQWETARALALKNWQIILLVVAPQALRAIALPMAGLLTLILQSTSLAALIGLDEFMQSGVHIVQTATILTGHTPAFQVFGFILVVYFCLSMAFTHMAGRFFRHYGSDRRV